MYLLAPLRPGNMSWAHLSCALWIPEVRVGNVEKMEPITNVDVVPVSMCVCVYVNIHFLENLTHEIFRNTIDYGFTNYLL